MNRRELVMLGAGGHAAVVAESAERSGFCVSGWAAAEPAEHGLYLGDPDGAGEAAVRDAVARGALLHAAVGSPELRSRWFARFGASAFAVVVDPAATVSETARIAEGAYIGAGAVVNARASIGCGAIVNTRAVVEHDCTVGAFAHIAPGAVLCGQVRVGDAAFIGAGAVVIPARRIGERATVGAGGVVVHDVASDATAIGVPTRQQPTRPPTLRA
jgi:sugar O-acyltransferase (sialic acid O-acetyltransferase NeuD family)